MPVVDDRLKPVHLLKARRALGMNRLEFGTAIGWSERTMARWETGQTDIWEPALLKAAQLVHPINPRLAEEIAVNCGSSLAELGLAQPEPPSGALPTHVLADSVVCAAADALKLAPEGVRLSVYASFRRARELRMTLEQVEQAMVLALGLDREKGKERDPSRKKPAPKES